MRRWMRAGRGSQHGFKELRECVVLCSVAVARRRPTKVEHTEADGVNGVACFHQKGMPIHASSLGRGLVAKWSSERNVRLAHFIGWRMLDPGGCPAFHRPLSRWALEGRHGRLGPQVFVKCIRVTSRSDGRSHSNHLYCVRSSTRSRLSDSPFQMFSVTPYVLKLNLTLPGRTRKLRSADTPANSADLTLDESSSSTGRLY